MRQDANDPTKKSAVFQGGYRAGQNIDGKGIRDSAAALVAAPGTSCCTNVSEGWLIMLGRITGPPSLAGASTVAPSRQSTWSAVVAAETTGFQYQWLVNNSPQSGAINRSWRTSFASGQQSLGVAVTRSDYTADTARMTVTVSLVAAMDGPSGVRPTQACTWFATTSGGVAAFHYSWTLDGNAVGSDQNSWSGLLATAGHSLGVTVTDAVNQSSSAQIGITVDATQPSCTI
ncbi:MAG: hypothetical protein ACR2OG_11770 [Gemmatimonadaceae bacterium]